MESTCVLTVEKELKQNIPLVSFTNGRLNDSTSERIQFKCYQNKSTGDGLQRKKAHKILVADSGRLQYSGQNFGKNAPKYEGLCKLHVGLLNKRTGKMKVFPSDLFHLKIILDDETCMNNEQFKNVTYEEKIDLLTSAFGSKKKRQSMDSRQKHLVKEDGLKTSLIEAVSASKAIAEKKPPVTPTDNILQMDILPPKNTSAKTVGDVYNLKDIITDSEYESLNTIANILLNASKDELKAWKESEEYSTYATTYVYFLAKSDPDRQHKGKVIAYIDCLLKLLKLKFLVIRSKDPLPSIANPLKNSILDKYALKGDNGKRSLSQRMKDKIMSHILVLLLLIQDYTINLGKLQVDFKIALTRIATIANSLGCHVTSKKNANGELTKIASLKLPLYELKDFKRRAQ